MCKTRCVPGSTRGAAACGPRSARALSSWPRPRAAAGFYNAPPAAPPVPPPARAAAAQHGNTALIIAALRGHLDVVTQLLEAGADTNKTDSVRPLGLRAAHGGSEQAPSVLRGGSGGGNGRDAGRGGGAVEQGLREPIETHLPAALLQNGRTAAQHGHKNTDTIRAIINGATPAALRKARLLPSPLVGSLQRCGV